MLKYTFSIIWLLTVCRSGFGTASAIFGIKGTKNTTPPKGGFGGTEEFRVINKEVAEANKSLQTKIPYEFMNDTVEHIFKGVVKNVGTADVSASGWHYLGKINPPGNKIIQVINKADEFGTIVAKVEIDGVTKKVFHHFLAINTL